MKKILFTLLAIALLGVAACSKDQRINRKLDGNWNVTTYQNTVVPAETPITYNFSKGKNGTGAGSYTISYMGFSTTKQFVYEIVNARMKYMVADSANTTAFLEITEHSKKKMVFVNIGDGNKTVMEAK